LGGFAEHLQVGRAYTENAASAQGDFDAWVYTRYPNWRGKLTGNPTEKIIGGNAGATAGADSDGFCEPILQEE